MQPVTAFRQLNMNEMFRLQFMFISLSDCCTNSAVFVHQLLVAIEAWMMNAFVIRWHSIHFVLFQSLFGATNTTQASGGLFGSTQPAAATPAFGTGTFGASTAF